MPGDDAWADIEAIIARGGSIKTVPPGQRNGQVQKPRRVERRCKKKKSGKVCGNKLSRFNTSRICFSCQGESPW